VLDNLSAGVLVLGSDQRLALANPSATRLLRAPLQGLIGQPLNQHPSLQALAQTIAEAFTSLDEQDNAGPSPHWLQQIEYPLPGSDATITLLARGARLALPGQPASVVVFDDISEVISAQRSLAWAEVARRLAHEIKNPLTPIQLSAERLQMKLAAKLEGADRDMLQRSTTTIVNQVQAMQHMVNDFRDYARLPAGKPEAMNLNALIQDVLNLYTSLPATMAPALTNSRRCGPTSLPICPTFSATPHSCGRSFTTCCKTPLMPSPHSPSARCAYAPRPCRRHLAPPCACV
jgi:multi-sensor signal transduction histidine kinase (EC 2.7.13.3)